MEAEVQLLGRITYEGFAAAWPHMEAETDQARVEAMGDVNLLVFDRDSHVQ